MLDKVPAFDSQSPEGHQAREERKQQAVAYKDHRTTALTDFWTALP